MKKIFYCLLLCLPYLYCREKYTPGLTTPNTGYLVIEGIINSGAGPTNIYLSRTNQFAGQGYTYESGAVVVVEGNDNSMKSLPDRGKGLYSADLPGLDNNIQYRLHITTTDGKEFLSDFATAKITPAIDTISWESENEGIQLFLNTHDEKNNTHYYQWDYVETWEINSSFRSFYKWEVNSVPPPNNNITIVAASADPSIFTCWQTDASTQILIGSSVKLSSDIINAMPIAFIPPGSEKLSVEYSILVRQFALTEDAYNFLSRIKKNTEQTGSVFDPQPSALNGNIHCKTNPAEMVIGYVSISSVEEKRIFIKATEVPAWDYKSTCMEDSIKDDSVEKKFAYGRGLLPTRIAIPGTWYMGAPKECIDCTLRGTNVKPDFWQ